MVMHIRRTPVGRLAVVFSLLASALLPTPSLASATAGPETCQFLTPSGAPSPIQHVIHIQFDNVHLTRDTPNVPSDLEQMPHLLNFIEGNGTLLANEHTPLIAHTADDLVTGLTGVYGNQHGIPISNSFEYYNSSQVGSYNVSAFTYWTDKISSDPANTSRQLPFEMIDSQGNNIPAPWRPFVDAGCNVGAISTVNMELENNGNDVDQVFGANSPEASESSSDRTNDFVGLAVHCADTQCSTVGTGIPTGGSKAKPELGGQGFGALYGHKYIATQVSPITETNGTAITGFNQTKWLRSDSSVHPRLHAVATEGKCAGCVWLRGGRARLPCQLPCDNARELDCVEHVRRSTVRRLRTGRARLCRPTEALGPGVPAVFR
ncbi:MAG: hypothetical protein JO057_27540 [Chloroflexi bacterium]|nr:hypothetical protein [Chloroflexota bacterium]